MRIKGIAPPQPSATPAGICVWVTEKCGPGYGLSVTLHAHSHFFSHLCIKPNIYNLFWKQTALQSFLCTDEVSMCVCLIVHVSPVSSHTLTSTQSHPVSSSPQIKAVWPLCLTPAGHPVLWILSNWWIQCQPLSITHWGWRLSSARGRLATNQQSSGNLLQYWPTIRERSVVEQEQ